MRTDKLLRLIGDIPDAYIMEAAPKEKSRRKTAWIKWCASAAACLAVVLAAVYVLPPFSHPINAPTASTTENVGSLQGASGGETTPSDTLENVSLHLNELSGMPSGGAAMFALLCDDFQAMTADELLRYYGVSLPAEDALPSLELQPQGESGGIYRNDDRGVYYDANAFFFETGDGSRSLSITLAKACKFVSGVRNERVSDQTLAFTELNGREVAVFHYTDEDGSDCCYVEFVQDGVAYYVTASNLSREDFIKALSVLLEVNTSGNAGDTHTLTGTVDAIDPNSNALGVTLDDGQEYDSVTVYLPEEKTAEYVLKEKVSVSYTGEPATVSCIWQQQLVSVEAIGE